MPFLHFSLLFSIFTMAISYKCGCFYHNCHLICNNFPLLLKIIMLNRKSLFIFGLNLNNSYD